jgi:hypothetical protein
MIASPERNKPDIVIYVHVTGAGDPSDEGSRWWQIRSKFDKEIRSILGDGFRIEQPFQLGNGARRGRQSASDSAAAARELGNYLSSYRS